MNMRIPGSLRRRERGVTLVELLVALVLGLLLTAGMIQVFVGNRTTFEFNDSLSRIQENARFTLDHIAYSARMGGYKGCLSDVAVYNNLTGGADDFRDNIDLGVEGYDANGSSVGWTPGLPAELAGLVRAGSDVLVVRSVGGGATPLVSPFTDGSQLFVAPGHDLGEGEILVVADCQKASVFQATDIAGGGANIVHADTGSFVPGNAVADWDAEQDYGLGAELSRLQTLAFYVGTRNDGRPALFQLRLTAAGAAASFTAEELAADVETLQVRYGIDSDSNGDVDELVSANAVLDWRRVVSVEVSLLARAADEYGTETDSAVYRMGGTTFDPADDRRLRQVFTTVVGVRNRLP